MKGLLSISLAFIYLALACGVTLKLHYCGGEIASVKLAFLADGHGCDCGDKAMESGCCKNEQHSFKLKSDQKHSEKAAISFTKFLKKAEFFSCLSEKRYFVPLRDYFTSYHGPPLAHQVPLFISHCVYRI